MDPGVPLSDRIEQAKAYIGVATDWSVAGEPVERGAIRRFAQASLDEDAIFCSDTDDNARFGGAVAPHLFPTFMFVRAFGAPDPLSERASDPDFDGTGTLATQGLPDIEPFGGLAILNGGSEVEFFSLANPGDDVEVHSRYSDIYCKETSKGPLIFVVIESEYRTRDGRPLLKVRRTQLRRERSVR